MVGAAQTYTAVSPGPLRLPPGNLEPLEEHPGEQSDYEDTEESQISESDSNRLTDIGEEYEDEDGGSLREVDPVFEKIKESLSRTQRSGSVASGISSISDVSDEGPQVQISELYTSVPYGIQPRATYEHSSMHADIMGVAYNGRMRQFVILDSKGITTWKRDRVEPREFSYISDQDLMPKSFTLTSDIVRRALQFPKYEYRLIKNIVYAPKYNCYFALGKDFSLKVVNRDFEETCSVDSNQGSVLFMLFNPLRDELITCGVSGIKIWEFKQKAGRSFTDLKPLANYELIEKGCLPNVGGSWMKRVDLDHHQQHLYCCSDTDLHVYNLQGKLLFRFDRAHTMSITGACFSPTAKVLITASVDSDVKVWSMTGGLVHTFRGHSRAVTGMLLHPESANIIITCSLDGSVRMWSLDTMDLLYMIVVSADGVLWMGLTDDKLLYISTCRNITLWHLNNFYTFWAMARSNLTRLSLSGSEDKTTRVVAEGDDSSIRIFTRCNQRNITTVLPPPDISALKSVLSVCYCRKKNIAFLLISPEEIWVYTTRTDPCCRIAIWDVHDLQMPYITGDTSTLPPSVIIQPPSNLLGPGSGQHRATENGHGNEVASMNCHSLCILNSTAMMWTDEGLCCPISHTYLLMGMEDGRILFMDPAVRGQKYMEFKACKDTITEMQHDVHHNLLITVCQLKQLALIQIWGLPQLDAMHEIYCAPDLTCYRTLGQSFMTGHTSGHLNFHHPEQTQDIGHLRSKQEPDYADVVDNERRPEHAAPIVAIDTVLSLRLYCTCSSDGAIKIWDEAKVLMTEVMLEESLSAATFLNDLGDLLVAFKKHIFYIDHTKLCPMFKPPDIEMETSDQESDVYEDPRVLYELTKDDPEPITLDNYLVPYENIVFDKDFLEGKTKIEKPKLVGQDESSESETESELSLAPSSVYLSPSSSIESLSAIDLTLGADYSKFDLHDQMRSTLDYMRRKGVRPIHKHTRIETPGQSDLEDRDLDLEMEKFSLPLFGESPGPTPSVSPPSGQVSPLPEITVIQVPTAERVEQEVDEGPLVEKPQSDFVPIDLPASSQVETVPKTKSLSSVPCAKHTATVTRRVTARVTHAHTLPHRPRTEYDTHTDTSPLARQLSSKHTAVSMTHTPDHPTLVTQIGYMTTSEPQSENMSDNEAPDSIQPDSTAVNDHAIHVNDMHIPVDEHLHLDSKSAYSTRMSLLESEPSLGTVSRSDIWDRDSGYGTVMSMASDWESQFSVSPTRFCTELAADDNKVLESDVVGSEPSKSPAAKHTHSTKASKVHNKAHAKHTADPHRTRGNNTMASTTLREDVSPGGGMDVSEYLEETSKQQKRFGLKQKLDVREIMKRRITTGRAPSLTRRSSTDHAHEEGHEHGHDDLTKRVRQDLKKKQQQMLLERKKTTRLDQLMQLPANPPSMLNRKESLSKERHSLAINLLHHPDLKREAYEQLDVRGDADLTGVRYDKEDLERAQEDMWAAEASLHATTLTLPPQRPENKARQTNGRAEARSRRLGGKFGLLGDGQEHTPGVGSSPTAELEDPGRQTPIGTSLVAPPGTAGIALTVQKPLPTADQSADDRDRTDRGTPDSGLADQLSGATVTPLVSVTRVTSDPEPKVVEPKSPGKEESALISEEDKAQAIKRPATSFTGLRRGQLEGERLKAERPHTAHVKFRAEDLQSAFEEALKNYQTLPGTEGAQTADTLYRNDGVNFQDNWQERIIERHILLRMQKQIRVQSAAQRRQAHGAIQQAQQEKLGITRTDTTVSMPQPDPLRRGATTSMSLPISARVQSAPPPSRDRPRPKTAHPALEKQRMMKNELSQEKAFRYRMSKDPMPVRPASSRSARSIASVADFSPHWVDPRNPDAWKPKSTRSIPSKCNRYVLLSKPRDRISAPIPSPLEEQLLAERFPRLGARIIPPLTPTPTPTITTSRSFNMEYSPFVYQRFL